MRIAALNYCFQWSEYYESLRVEQVKMATTLPAKPWGEDYGEEYEAAIIGAKMSPKMSPKMSVLLDIRCPPSIARQKDGDAIYAAYAALVAKRRAEVSEFVLWEEPNCPVTAHGVGVGDYSRMVKAASNEIRIARPDARVYNGGVGLHGETWMLEELAESGALACVDAVNLHPFIYSFEVEEIAQGLDSVLSAAKAYGKPIIVSEWGIPTTPTPSKLPSMIYADGVASLSEEQQADAMECCLHVFRDHAVEMVTLFVQDCGTTPYAHWSHSCGLLSCTERGIKPKSSYYTTKEWIEKYA